MTDQTKMASTHTDMVRSPAVSSPAVSSHTATEPEARALAEACLRLSRVMTNRFRAFLKPGERLVVSIEREQEFVYARLSLTQPAGQFRFDLEAAVLNFDQVNADIETRSPEDRLELAVEFLRTQLHDYFRQRRTLRFHIDWRIYTFESTQIRFRAREHRPSLEAAADEMLGETSDD